MSSPAPRLLSGWGRAAPTAAMVLCPRSQSEVDQILSAPRRGARRHYLPRGLGRAYGDAAQCAGGYVLDCTGLTSVLGLDHDKATLRAEAGASFDRLVNLLLPHGFFLPVTPGTRYVTLGGAIASDIHGKNHHVDGSLARYVQRIRLATPAGPVVCGPGQHVDEFNATCGGMGLTGVVTEATIGLLRVETSSMVVDTQRAPDLDACLALLSEEGSQYRYSVAWVDGLASGRHLGRSVLTRGDHARTDQLPAGGRANPLRYRARQRLSVPFTPPVSLLNPMTVRAFNEMWYRKAPKRRRTELHSLSSFFYPLDALGRWNHLYGPRGFTQYQFAVPFGAERVLRAALEKMSRARVASFLAVLKRFGDQGDGPMSFPMPGWTLALDMALATPGLGAVLDEIDLMVAEAGGRVYLSKDGRLRPALVRAMYPRLDEWAMVRARLDPEASFSSDLARRLGLVGAKETGK